MTSVFTNSWMAFAKAYQTCRVMLFAIFHKVVTILEWSFRYESKMNKNTVSLPRKSQLLFWTPSVWSGSFRWHAQRPPPQTSWMEIRWNSKPPGPPLTGPPWPWCPPWTGWCGCLLLLAAATAAITMRKMTAVKICLHFYSRWKQQGRRRFV